MRSLALILRGLLDRMVLVSAAVAGGLLPGFIAQYRQRLGGRLDQARIDLAGWQKLADQFFQGDINRLIQYHLDSTNASFHAEGSVIQSLVASVQRLQDAVAGLKGNVFRQAAFLTRHLDPGLAHSTLGDWVPTFTFSLDGLTFALIFAVLVWCLFHLLWLLLALLARALTGSGSTGSLRSGSRARNI